MHLLEAYYNRSPIFLQNGLISLYGIKLYYERFLGNHKYYLDWLLQSQWWSSQKIMGYQLAKVKELLQYSSENIPYYNKVFKKNNLSVSDFKSLEDIKLLPILDKETVRSKSELLISKKIPQRKLIKIHTSGSTGKTLKIFVDIDSRRKEYAFKSRLHKWAGLQNGKHNVTFGGRVVVPPGQKKKIFWRYNAVMDNFIFSSYHMSDENLPYYVEKLKKIEPLWIESYPSAIYTLAKYMLDKNINELSPKVIITSAETLLDYQRDVVEKVFNCPIIDNYGCSEQAIFVSQCEKGTYHIHPEYGIVEILNDQGDEVSPGEIGRVVCTGFVNNAMPLIRYDIGDKVIQGEGICECGRSFPIIKKIFGRKDDIIVTPTGRHIGRLDPVFKGLLSVKMAQIVQTRINEIIVKIVPSNNYSDDDTKIIKNEMKNRVGENIKIEVELVKDIPKSKNGKFKSVISKIS